MISICSGDSTLQGPAIHSGLSLVKVDENSGDVDKLPINFSTKVFKDYENYKQGVIFAREIKF
jgi:hypothetical protein